jgi:hypothetical protein
MAALALPRARALPPQGSSLPQARFISALGPATEPATLYQHSFSQCPVGLYLPALFQGLRSQDACAHTHEHGHAHKHIHTSNWQRSTHAHSHSGTRTGRALTYETIGATPPWTREQWRSATKASKRRPSTRCERKAKAKAKKRSSRLATLSSSIKRRSSPAGSRWCR